MATEKRAIHNSIVRKFGVGLTFSNPYGTTNTTRVLDNALYRTPSRSDSSRQRYRVNADTRTENVCFRSAPTTIHRRPSVRSLAVGPSVGRRAPTLGRHRSGKVKGFFVCFFFIIRRRRERAVASITKTIRRRRSAGGAGRCSAPLEDEKNRYQRARPKTHSRERETPSPAGPSGAETTVLIVDGTDGTVRAGVRRRRRRLLGVWRVRNHSPRLDGTTKKTRRGWIDVGPEEEGALENRARSRRGTRAPTTCERRTVAEI